MTFTFTSDKFPDGLECVYRTKETFDYKRDFVVALQPDLTNNANDDIIVDSLTVESESLSLASL